jgi:hypothetical protein
VAGAISYLPSEFKHWLRGRHAVSSIVEAGFELNELDAHWVFKVQPRSACELGAELSYSTEGEMHTDRSAQTASVVSVRLVAVYLPSSLRHWVASVHTRSVVAVAGVDVYAEEPQLVNAAHVRSEVLVGATVSYWVVVEQTVSAVHTESSAVALALLTYAEAEHAVLVVQPRSACELGAELS